MSRKPRWAEKEGQKHDDDPYGFEESDARSLSRGSTGRTPGSGRLFPGQLDSEVDDFKTDNKVTESASYRINRGFWLERLQKCRVSGHNFRESILFKWTDDRGDRNQLHIVAVEGNVFEEIYNGYRDLHSILSEDATIEEITAKHTHKTSTNTKWS